MTSNTIGDPSDVTVNNLLATHVPAGNNASVFDYFWNAGFLIKFVIISLLVASVWSWTVIIGKHLRLKRLVAEADAFEDSFWSGTPLESLYDEVKDSAFDPISNIFCAAMAEWRRFAGRRKNQDVAGSKAVEMKIDRIMQIAIRKEVDGLERNMGFLSSLGTNGVLVGLFGTVIGILNGFKAIAVQQSVNIATVAPVLSEALITTALGLVAAIPAALGYNKLMGDTSRYISRLETFADEFGSIIARQFDE
jgi:biopolymer transport protein TolQ